jgi:hypothetical protein
MFNYLKANQPLHHTPMLLWRMTLQSLGFLRIFISKVDDV